MPRIGPCKPSQGIFPADRAAERDMERRMEFVFDKNYHKFIPVIPITNKNYTIMDYDFLRNALVGMGVGMIVFSLAVMVFMIISWWIVFKKAGQPGWAILIPIYNFLIMLRIAGKPWWWVFGILLAIIPIVGALLLLVLMILVYHGISTNFGKGAGFTVGLVLLSIVFVPILAFGKAEYKG